jgi:hypothetical protein
LLCSFWAPAGTRSQPNLFALPVRRLLVYEEVAFELPERFDKPQGWKLQAKSPKVGELYVFYPRAHAWFASRDCARRYAAASSRLAAALAFLPLGPRALRLQDIFEA